MLKCSPMSMKKQKHIDGFDITRTHDLTIDEIKSVSMFAHFTDEQGTEAVRTLKAFIEIALDAHLREKAAEKNSCPPPIRALRA